MTSTTQAQWPKLMLGAVGLVIVLLGMMAQPLLPTAAQGTTHTPANSGSSPIDNRFSTLSAVAGGEKPLTGQLVYIARPQDAYELFTLDFESGKTQQLTDDGVNKWWPEWSHDGTRIAYVRDMPDEQQYAVFIMDADGANEQRITPAGLNFICVDWSLDDTQLVMCAGKGIYENTKLDIYTINVDGTGLTQITNNPGKDYEPQWSPDGAWIAFGSDRDRPSNVGGEYSQVYTMRADGSDVQQLTNTEKSSFAPSWSPDGSLIAYAGDCTEPTYGTICLMNADGTEKHSVFTSRYDIAPRWSPDGKYLIVSRMGASGDLASAELHVLSIVGEEDRQITDNTWMDLLPHWK